VKILDSLLVDRAGDGTESVDVDVGLKGCFDNDQFRFWLRDLVSSCCGEDE